jgi:2',3'-cyclic-nucleotide 2'-phosphodiesterase
MKILMVGDIAGAPGRRVFCREATRMRAAGEADVIIANAENSAGGKGLTAAIAEELLAGGADVLTLGDHTWDQKDVAAFLERSARVVRPANFAPGCPGRGWTTVPVGGTDVSVLNLVGRVFTKPVYDCPFRTADAVLKQEKPGRVVVVDLHAEATSEKIVLGRYLDGRVSVVAGTHTHVQTSDETVLPGGTAYITDLGMTGAKDSAIGRDLQSVTRMFLTGMPATFKMATASVALEGALIDVDERSGRARSIRRLRIRE